MKPEKYLEIIDLLINEIGDLHYDYRQDWCENKAQVMQSIQHLLIAKENLELALKNLKK